MTASHRLLTSLSHALTRRRLLGGASVAAAVAGLARVPGMAQDAATPSASPAATPAASPVATPAPNPIPPHALTIIQDTAPTYSGDPVKGGTLRLAAQREGLRSFNPTAQQQDLTALYAVHDPLVMVDPETMEPRPWLATTWAWSADGLSLSFDLRTDVTFHDGSPFTANDVRFSLLAYRDDYDSALAGMFAFVTDVVVESESRATVQFAEPDGAFLFNAASQPMFSAAQYGAQWESRPVGERSISGYDWDAQSPLGTGPWSVAEASDDALTLRRHDAYWAGPAHFDELQLVAEDDSAKRIEAWKNGDIDVLPGVRATDLDGLWDEDGRLYVAPSATTFFAAFNVANPANATPDMMADLALRQALSLAVDRKKYANDVFFTFIDERKAGTIVQPWAHDDGIRNPAFDIDEANRILDEGGWSDIDGDGMREDARGNRLDLYLIVANTERPELLSIIDELAEDFVKIGARLTVEKLDPGPFDERWSQNRMYDMIAYSLVGYPAFSHFDLYGTAWDIRANTVGWNPGGYSNDQVDAAIDAYFASVTEEDMRAALVSLQEGANDDLFGLWFGFPDDLVLVRNDVQGFVPNMYLQTMGTASWWRGEGEVRGASPDATPSATPGATPAVPGATPDTDIPVTFFEEATPES